MAVLTNGTNTIEIGSTTWRSLINDNFTKLDRLLNRLVSRFRTSSTTIVVTEALLVADANSGAIVLTLPDSSTILDGHTVRVRVVDATNTVTIQRAGSDTIDDAQTSIVLSTLGGVTLIWSAAASRWVSF
jgi:hypothetical protein